MPDRRRILGYIAALPPLALFGGTVRADTPEVYSVGGVALGGTDPVGYQRTGAPLAGDPAQALMWRGATWHFDNAAHREAFEMHPDAYSPAYGGWCAYAMARGALAPTVPDAWTIHDDRLYLNNSLATRAIWQSDIAQFIAAADRNWQAMQG